MRRWVRPSRTPTASSSAAVLVTIAGCSPLNIFDVNSAAGVAVSPYVVTPFYNTLYTLRQFEANFSGMSC